MAEEVQTPAPLPLSSMMDKDKEDSAAALEQEFTTTPTSKEAASGGSMDHYVALAAAAANHCVCARVLVLVLAADTGIGMVMGLFLAAVCAAGIAAFAARDLAAFRSLWNWKAAAEDHDDVAHPMKND